MNVVIFFFYMILYVVIDGIFCTKLNNGNFQINLIDNKKFEVFECECGELNVVKCISNVKNLNLYTLFFDILDDESNILELQNKTIGMDEIFIIRKGVLEIKNEIIGNFTNVNNLFC